eukprot:gb/GECG01014845.1/.p1 GENE.gb/GECG01014845.1/~~gb/GECG01014845.1/.p1  ORF type:complete len:629 (+),score=143.31 gb/GECG01014845.1/:1-1887(+)
MASSCPSPTSSPLTPYWRLPQALWHENLEEREPPTEAVEGEKARRGRYVVARERIPEGSILVHVPQECCIMAQGSEHERLMHFLKQEKQLNSLFAVALVLLHEISQGEPKSKFGKHLETLPENFTSALYFDEEAKRLLKNTTLEGMLDSLPVYERWEKEIAPLMEERSEFWNLKVQSFEHFRRALALVLSRGFHDHKMEGPHLVPVVDLLNHHCTKACTCPAFEYSGDKFQFRMYAHRDIEAGEEVYNTYGNLSDAQLLHTYGFIHEDCFNPQNCVALEAKYVIDAAKEIMSADAVVNSALYDEGELKSSRSQIMDDAKDLIDKKVVLLQAAGQFPDDSKNGLFNIDSDLKLPEHLGSCLQVLAMDEGQYWAFKNSCEGTERQSNGDNGEAAKNPTSRADDKKRGATDNSSGANTKRQKVSSEDGSFVSTASRTSERVTAPVLKLSQPWVKEESKGATESSNGQTESSKDHKKEETNHSNDSGEEQKEQENDAPPSSSAAFSINFSKVVKEEAKRDEEDCEDNEEAADDDTEPAEKDDDEHNWGTGSRPYWILQRAIESKLENYISDEELVKKSTPEEHKANPYQALIRDMCKHVVLSEQKLLLSLMQHLDKVIEETETKEEEDEQDE